MLFLGVGNAVLIYCWPFQCDASVVVYSRIALWPSVGKELSPWLFTCAVFILVLS